MTRAEADPLFDEALRAAALALLDASGDARARAVLERARITVQRDVAQWDASPGAVHAHRVLLGVRAEDLGLIASAPAVHDELCRVLAAAISAHDPHQSLSDLREYWAIADAASAAPGGSPYRPAPPRAAHAADPAAVHDALTDLLAALGEGALAHLVARAELTVRGEAARARVTLVLPADAPARDPHRRAVLERAVGLLLAGPDERAVDLTVRVR